MADRETLMTEFEPERDTDAPRTNLKTDVPSSYVPKRRASRLRRWGTGVVVAAGILSVMYGITIYRADTQDEQRQTQLQRDMAPSAAPGRGGAATSPAPQSGG